MTGNELIRKLKSLGKSVGVDVRYDPTRGKGSHGQLHFGTRFTTIKDPRKEIGSGLLKKMLDDLALTKDDLT